MPFFSFVSLREIFFRFVFFTSHTRACNSLVQPHIKYVDIHFIPIRANTLSCTRRRYQLHLSISETAASHSSNLNHPVIPALFYPISNFLQLVQAHIISFFEPPLLLYISPVFSSFSFSPCATSHHHLPPPYPSTTILLPLFLYPVLTSTLLPRKGPKGHQPSPHLHLN